MQGSIKKEFQDKEERMLSSIASTHNYSNTFLLFIINKMISETVISVPTGSLFHNNVLCHWSMHGNLYAG